MKTPTTIVFLMMIIISHKATAEARTNTQYLIATENRQTFSSPGYPFYYKTNELRMWVIKTQNHDKTVVLHVLDSHIEKESNCPFDYVEAYDGIHSYYPVILRWCGTFTPTIISSGNAIFLRFVSDGSYTDSGFKIEYYESGNICGQKLSSMSTNKTFLSPHYPSQLFSASKCEWSFVADNPNKTVTVIFLTASMSFGCHDGNVSVYDGNASLNILLGIWYGNQDLMFHSSGNSLSVCLMTQISRRASCGFRFKIQYSESPPLECGGQLFAKSDSSFVTSPGYPGNYNNNMKCTWTIIAEDPSSTVKLQVIDSALEPDKYCTKDSVKVYNIKNSNYHTRKYSSLTLGKFCSNNKPWYQSPGRSIRIVFLTNEKNTYRGFKLEYSQADARVCGGNMTAYGLQARIKSPGYPIRYYRNLHCEWIITGPVGKYIRLYVEDSLLQPCSNTSVKLFDEASPDRYFASWCGGQMPQILSLSSRVIVRFKTDGSPPKRGFSMMYFVSDYSCGGIHVASSSGSYLRSPGYPIGYPNNITCQWKISAKDKTKVVKLMVEDSLLETSVNCSSDRASVFDGSTIYSPLLGFWCGHSKPTYQSRGRHLLLVFTTDGADRLKGFRLVYNQISGNRKEITLTARSTESTLTSPGYPQPYEDDMDYTWLITTESPSYRVSVQVLRSDIEQAVGCRLDKLKFYDGTSAFSVVLGTLCGFRTPSYTSTRRHMFLQFISDSSTTGRGFSLQYKQVISSVGVCQDVTTISVVTTYGFLTSPNYPDNYPNNADCSWRLKTDDEFLIEIITYILPLGSMCAQDYIEVFDGFDDQSSSLGRWCGNKRQTYRSSASYMFVKFKSDSLETHAGFKFKYHAVSKSEYESSTSKVYSGTIVGGVIGGVIFLVFVLCLIGCCSCRKNANCTRNSPRRPSPTNTPTNQQDERSVYYITETNRGQHYNPLMFADPPPYSMVISKDFPGTVFDSTPPPFYPTAPSQETENNMNQEFEGNTGQRIGSNLLENDPSTAQNCLPETDDNTIEQTSL